MPASVVTPIANLSWFEHGIYLQYTPIMPIQWSKNMISQCLNIPNLDNVGGFSLTFQTKPLLKSTVDLLNIGETRPGVGFR